MWLILSSFSVGMKANFGEISQLLSNEVMMPFQKAICLRVRKRLSSIIGRISLLTFCIELEVAALLCDSICAEISHWLSYYCWCVREGSECLCREVFNATFDEKMFFLLLSSLVLSLVVGNYGYPFLNIRKCMKLISKLDGMFASLAWQVLIYIVKSSQLLIFPIKSAMISFHAQSYNL